MQLHVKGKNLEVSDSIRSYAERKLGKLDRKLKDSTRVEVELTEIWYQKPIAFDAGCIGALRHGAETIGLPAMEIISGAGHDACNMSAIAPTGMVFVPCKDGISHNEVESATKEDCAAGCNVLLHALIERANAV